MPSTPVMTGRRHFWRILAPFTQSRRNPKSVTADGRALVRGTRSTALLVPMHEALTRAWVEDPFSLEQTGSIRPLRAPTMVAPTRFAEPGRGHLCIGSNLGKIATAPAPSAKRTGCMLDIPMWAGDRPSWSRASVLAGFLTSTKGPISPGRAPVLPAPLTTPPRSSPRRDSPNCTADFTTPP